jgi:hypothetical protein
MPVEHLTGRTSRRHWLLVALSIGLALAVALSMALAGDAEAKKKKGGGAKRYTKTSLPVPQVNQVNFVLTQASNPLTAQPYTIGGTKKIKSITNVSATLRAAAFFPNDTGLHLGLDGIDTGIRITGLSNAVFTTVTVTGTPQNASQIVQQLKADGQLVGTIIDRTPGDNVLFVDGTANTTLTLQGKLQKKKKK